MVLEIDFFKFVFSTATTLNFNICDPYIPLSVLARTINATA